jgi:DNA-binding MarR family transcriptional regulator
MARVSVDTSPEPAPLPDVLEFMQLLWAVVHGLERKSKRMSGELGVTGPQRLVLRVVGLYPGVSAGELADILRIHPSTLTGILRRLVGQRLLLRVTHREDRRRAVLHLTARGERANAVRNGTAEAAISDALGTLGERERASARRVLAELAVHLEPRAAKRATRRSRRLP